MKNLTFILLFMLFFPYTNIGAEPFQSGEKLTYLLKWTFIKAGTAIVEVRPNAIIDGRECRHFSLTVKTNDFIDHFYKVRDRIDAYTDLEMTHSILYIKKQREGKTHRDIKVIFDWVKKQAQYSNFKKKKSAITLLPGAFDPLALFYFSRLCDPTEHGSIKRPVTDGKKCVMGVAKLIKKETIKLSGKKYKTYLLEPDIQHIGGVFEKSKNAKIRLWVSADHRRIPIKLKSKVVIGHFSAELISIETATNRSKK